MGSSSRTLKTLLVDPFRQIKFGLYVIALVLFFVFSSLGIFVLAFRSQYRHLLEVFEVVDPALQWEVVLDAVFYANFLRVLLFFGLFLLITFLVVLRLTHRYYGPLISIERFLEELIVGRYEARVAIRSRDELQDLVHKLNTLAQVLQARYPMEQNDALKPPQEDASSSSDPKEL